MIKAKDVPIKYYNYSFIKDLLEQKYNQKIFLPTIIDRAKRNNFYFLRPKRKAHDHDKEVITNYPGELIQQLRISPDKESGVSELRFWHKDEFLGMQKVKNSNLKLVHF